MNDEPRRWRLRTQIVEKVALCNSRKGFSDMDEGDLWLVDCDFDLGHEGNHSDGNTWWDDELKIVSPPPVVQPEELK